MPHRLLNHITVFSHLFHIYYFDIRFYKSKSPKLRQFGELSLKFWMPASKDALNFEVLKEKLFYDKLAWLLAQHNRLKIEGTSSRIAISFRGHWKELM